MTAVEIDIAPMHDPRAAKFLPVNKLRIHARAQRPIDQRRIERMASEWNWDLAEAVTVTAAPDGMYEVTEGQNRTEALRLIDPGASILCVVLPPQSDASQAGTALSIHRGRRALSALDSYALRITSEDPVALAIRDLMESREIEVSSNDGPRRTKAVSALMAIATAGRGRTTLEDGIDLLGRTLDVILHAWPTDPHAGRDDRFPSDILKAVAEVLARGYDDKAVAKKLRAKRGPEYWLGLTGGASRRESIVTNLIASLGLPPQG